MKRGTKILLFSLLGAGGLIFLVCGGLIFVGIKGLQELPKALASSDAFMDQLKTGDVEEAYKATTVEFKASMDLDRFRDFVAKYPAFTKQSSRTVGGMRLFATGQGPRAQIQYNLSNPNNTLSLVVILKGVDGKWKVESLNLP
jgi:hypothetical protein